MAIHVIKGNGAPNVVPLEVGCHYIDMVDRVTYISVGTATVSDWIISGQASTSFSTFLSLLDTPVSYTGFAGLTAKVNVSEDALEFSNPNLRDLSDIDAAAISDNEVLAWSDASQKWEPEYRMDWRGIWSASTYPKMSVVSDQNWTMVSNKETSQRAAPQAAAGASFGIPDNISWTNGTGTPFAISGYKVAFTKLTLVSGIRIYRTDVGPSVTSVLSIYDASDPLALVLISSRLVKNGAVGWQVEDLPARFVDNGAVLVFELKTSKTSSVNTWTHRYNLEDRSGAPIPDPGAWTLDSNNSVLKVSFTDYDGINQAQDLTAVRVGDTIRFASPTNSSIWEVFQVDSVRGFSLYMQFIVQRIDFGSPNLVGQVANATATIAVSVVPASYVKVPNYWLGKEPVSGADASSYFRQDILDPISFTRDAVGIDILCTAYDKPSDWDIVAISSIGATGSSSGGGSDRFTDLLDTPQNYTGAAGKAVYVNSTGTGLIFQIATVAAHASTHATGGSDPLTPAMIGLGNVNNTSDAAKPISTATQTALNAKYDASNPAGYITSAGVPVKSVNTKTGDVVLAKGDVGLSNVDNTTDLGKPISTATQTALNAKYDASNPAGYVTASTAPVTSVNTKTGAVTLAKADIGLGNVDNTSDAAKPISTQTQTALNAKYDASNPAGYVTASTAPVTSVNTKTGAVTLAKDDVGLGNVDNTSDAAKPVSTATQTALNAKQATITGAASSIVSTDLSASKVLISDANGKVSASSITTTEVGQLSGVTSNIQTQLNAKQATVTGAITTVVSTDLSASKVVVSDINGKIAAGSATAAEVGQLSGVTSNVQTQLNAKEPTITGAASSIVSTNLSASKAIVSDANGKISESAATATEVGYLSGVTSNIQTQINAIAGASGGTVIDKNFNNTTGTQVTLTSTDYGNLIKAINVSGTCYLNILAPTDAAILNKELKLVQGVIAANSLLIVRYGTTEVIHFRAFGDQITLLSNGTDYLILDRDISPYVQYITTGQTWTKPPNCKGIYVKTIGGGAAGNVGAIAGSTSVKTGGAGGGGGGYSETLLDASEVGASLTIVIGAGGTPTTGSTTTGSGSVGGTGGTTRFGNFVLAIGGAQNGTTVSATTPYVPAKEGGTGYIDGGAPGQGTLNNEAPAAAISGNYITGAGGGGAGGTTAKAGASGSQGSLNLLTSTTAGSGGPATGTGAGVAGGSHTTAFPNGFGGGGGGGGGALINTATAGVGAGGNGGFPGGGGGGSSARVTGATNVAGAGGAGAVYIKVRY